MLAGAEPRTLSLRRLLAVLLTMALCLAIFVEHTVFDFVHAPYLRGIFSFVIHAASAIRS